MNEVQLSVQDLTEQTKDTAEELRRLSRFGRQQFRENEQRLQELGDEVGLLTIRARELAAKGQDVADELKSVAAQMGEAARVAQQALQGVENVARDLPAQIEPIREWVTGTDSQSQLPVNLSGWLESYRGTLNEGFLKPVLGYLRVVPNVPTAAPSPPAQGPNASPGRPAKASCQVPTGTPQAGGADANNRTITEDAKVLGGAVADRLVQDLDPNNNLLVSKLDAKVSGLLDELSGVTLLLKILLGFLIACAVVMTWAVVWYLYRRAQTG